MASGVCVENNSCAECGKFQRNEPIDYFGNYKKNTLCIKCNGAQRSPKNKNGKIPDLRKIHAAIKGSLPSQRNLRSRGVKKTILNEFSRKNKSTSKPNIQEESEMLSITSPHNEKRLRLSDNGKRLSITKEENFVLCTMCGKDVDGITCTTKCHLNGFQLSVTQDKATYLCQCNGITTNGFNGIRNGMQKFESTITAKNGLHLNGVVHVGGKNGTVCRCLKPPTDKGNKASAIALTNSTDKLQCDLSKSESNNNSILQISQVNPSTSNGSHHSTDPGPTTVAINDVEHPIFGRRNKSTDSLLSIASTDSNDSKLCNKSDTTVKCKWVNCKELLEGSLLIDHICDAHLKQQFANSDVYVCLWEGCKVFNKSSSSKNWLERHVLQHSGDKPHRCIVDGCGMRFTSRGGLERHVNSHFNVILPPPAKLPRSKDNTPSKISSAKKRKLKHRRIKKKTADFFDCRSLEGIKERLFIFDQKTGIDNQGLGRTITFHSTVIAKKKEMGSKTKFLIHWTPENMLPDEWLPKCLVEKTRILPIHALPPQGLLAVDPTLYSPHRKRKQRRK